MNEIIKKITEKIINTCPEISIKKDTFYPLIIEPKNDKGFGIYLEIDKRENTLHFDSFHFHFENSNAGDKDLLSYFGYALSNYSRLKVYSKGNKEYKWKFEIQDKKSKNWISCGTISILNFNPFKKSKISYRQNDWIEIRESN